LAILVDSSVWIDYFNGVGTPQTDHLDALLGREEMVVGRHRGLAAHENPPPRARRVHLVTREEVRMSLEEGLQPVLGVERLLDQLQQMLLILEEEDLASHGITWCRSNLSTREELAPRV